MIRAAALCSVGAVAAAVLSVGAAAYQVAPMVYELAPSGPEAGTVLRVENTGASPITIEIVAERRRYDEDGREQRTPADEDFAIFPPQAVVAPGTTQSVRVRYVGDPVPPHSLTYALMVRQLPVALAANGSNGVQFVFNFATVAHVVPRGAIADVRITEAARRGDTLNISFRNQGTKYGRLDQAGLKISGPGGYAFTLSRDDLRDRHGLTWILPESTRIASIKLPPDAPAGEEWRAESVAPAGP